MLLRAATGLEQEKVRSVDSAGDREAAGGMEDTVCDAKQKLNLPTITACLVNKGRVTTCAFQVTYCRQQRLPSATTQHPASLLFSTALRSLTIEYPFLLSALHTHLGTMKLRSGHRTDHTCSSRDDIPVRDNLIITPG